jgi:hypothetical protein
MVMYYLKYGCHPWNPPEKPQKDFVPSVKQDVSNGLRPPLGDHSSCVGPSDCKDHETAPKQNDEKIYYFWNCFEKRWVEKLVKNAMKNNIQLFKKRIFANSYDEKYLNLMSVLSSASHAAALMFSPSWQARVLEPQS